jgi:hypothetical protein
MAILEKRGLFWWHDEPVPDRQFAPENSVPGLLTIDNEGYISLDLDGFLPSMNGPVAAFFDDRSVEISGRCIEGFLKESSQKVLLTGLIKSGGRLSSAGMSYAGYIANNCHVSTDAFVLSLLAASKLNRKAAAWSAVTAAVVGANAIPQIIEALKKGALLWF